MKRGTPMKRTAFKSKRHQPTYQREERPMAKLSPATRRASYAGTTTAGAAEKERPARSEAYRRLVAAMPCICGCGRPPPSQCAHPNTGKGMGLKTDDRLSFPLHPHCHRAFDQGALFDKATRRGIEPVWGFLTRTSVYLSGKWPKTLPLWTEES